jgi:transposase-like protein
MCFETIRDALSQSAIGQRSVEQQVWAARARPENRSIPTPSLAICSGARTKLRVAKKRVIGRYPKAFRKMAVERLKRSDNIVALSQELGVHRRLLYKWRDQLEPIEDGEAPRANSRERELRQPVTQLKRVVADKTLEAEFFKGARM